ncbi:hypothetical protein CR970_04515 [Candidatus Saccharibacteria bacterium]|nr:MAG: hypothetical protein CR970_04515 [Candidatus Saccharibacteria bacterium]
MLIKPILLFIVGVAVLALGALVLLRDYRRSVNVLFALLTAAVAAWSIGIGVFLLQDLPASAIWWAKLYYVAPLVLVTSLVLFAKAFPDERIGLPFYALIVTPALSCAVMTLSQDTFLIHGIAYREWGKEILLQDMAYLAYSTIVMSYFIYGLGIMLGKSIVGLGLYRRQAGFFFVGGALSAANGLVFDLILPWFGNYRLTWIGPLATSFFVSLVALSIVRHRMFDIRRVIARTIGYVISLFVLAVLYGAFVLVIVMLVLRQELSLYNIVIFSFSAAIVSIIFSPIKQFFDKQTSRVFYRDGYDSEQVIAEVNQITLTNVDVAVLLESTCKALIKHMRIEMCVFELTSEDGDARRFGTYRTSLTEALNELGDYVHSRKIAYPVVVSDAYGYGEATLMRDSLFRKANVEVAFRLGGLNSTDSSSLGMLYIGPKKSGDPFVNTDIRLLELIVGEVTIALRNAMRYEQIERMNADLEKRIAEATHKLKRTNDKLLRMDETKDEFITMASHQLRTPLTSIKGYLSMVLEGDGGSLAPLQRKMLDQSFISAQRMVALIADLLNVSRLRTGKFVLEPKMSNLATVVKQEAAQLQGTAKSRRLKLTVDAPKKFPRLYMDETKIRQVVMNFIDNAIYYTPPGGNIHVVVRETEKTISLTVTDDGIGVPKHEQYHLFTKFYRAGNARKARPDGTGLGLFMAKKVVVAQGGAILFKSKEGKGSQFGFTFAKSKLRPPADQS